jgi:ABC-type spermidine/putrescine transport system permease subunit II
MKRIRLAGIVTLCALIPLLAPTVLAVLASLPQGELLTFPPTGFTMHYPTFDDGLEQVLVGEAIAESARLGQWVSVHR